MPAGRTAAGIITIVTGSATITAIITIRTARRVRVSPLKASRITRRPRIIRIRIIRTARTPDKDNFVSAVVQTAADRSKYTDGLHNEPERKIFITKACTF